MRQTFAVKAAASHVPQLVLDLVVVAVCLGGGYLLAARFDLFAQLEAAVAANPGQPVADVVGGLFLAACGLALYGMARSFGRAKTQAARAAAEEQASSAAMHDQLTGLPNRRHFKGVLNWHLAQQGDARKMAVVALNLDGFRQVNDLHGRAVGDELLNSVGQLINMRAGVDGFAARLGGDDFAIVLLGQGEEFVMDWLPALITTLEQPFTLTSKTVEIGATAGVAFGPADAGDAETLLHRADVALRRAKEKTRGWFAFFKAGMDERIHERAMFEHDLWVAVRDDLVEPYFQPVVQLHDGRTAGYEVLARWTHHARGLLLPAHFIPAAEGAGLIGDLTLNLLGKACREALAWPGEPQLTVNLSPQMLDDPRLAKKILKVLAETSFPASRLEIELTETALVTDFAAAREIFAALKAQGVKLALDNFGAGHTSLRQLRELPFDTLKIDRSLVAAMADDTEAALMVRSMSALAQNLGLQVVAEGVETPEQAQALLAMGLDFGQGHHFGKAVAAADVVKPAKKRKRVVEPVEPEQAA